MVTFGRVLFYINIYINLVFTQKTLWQPVSSVLKFL